MFECKVGSRRFKNKNSLKSHMGYHKRTLPPPPPPEPTKPDTTRVGEKSKLETRKANASADQGSQAVGPEDGKAAEIRA